jgi:GNAT superfamily N-acetyltransferase
MILQQATADDWALVRTIRLEALRSEPGVFGSHFAREVDRDEAAWRDWTAGPTKAVFLLFDDSHVVGLTGVYAPANDPSRSAVCVASYLQPPYRGRGLSRLFYEARIEWARAQGYTRLVTGHRLSNRASMQANQHFGFKETHRLPHTWPDGVEEPEVIYELRLGDD